MNLSRILWLRILAGATLLWTTASFAQEAPQDSGSCLAGEYIMTVSGSPAKRAEAAAELSQASYEKMEISEESIGAVLVTSKKSQGARLARFEEYNRLHPCERLKRRQRARIRSIRQGLSANRIVRRYRCDCNKKVDLAAVPDDSLFNYQWGLSQENDIDIDAPEAWEIFRGDPSFVVAVIDTGIDYTHPDLEENMWVNPGEVPGNGVDDDGNGWVDDVHGVNAIYHSGDPADDHGHGTHVGGTISARTNNSKGVAGVNWNIKLMGVKFLSSSGSGSLFDAIEAIDYVTQMKQRGVNVVLSNNSWGGRGTSPGALNDAVARANNAGLLFVAAAGNSSADNDTTGFFPANISYSNVISVAAVGSSGSLASFSNYGSEKVHLAAPGVNIASTYPGNRYVYMSGTSMAAPHVAGALALLKSYSWAMEPDELKSNLLTSVTQLSSLSGLVRTGGLLNVYRMLADAPDPGIRPTPVPTPTHTPLPTPTATPVPTATPTPTPTIAPGIHSITGNVRFNNTGLNGVALTLTTKDGSVTRYSGDNGSYRFDKVVTPTDWSMTAAKSGFSFSVLSGSLTTSDIVVDVQADSVNEETLCTDVISPLGEPQSNFDIAVEWLFMGERGESQCSTGQTGCCAMLPYGAEYTLTTVHRDGYRMFDDLLSGSIYGPTRRVFVAIDE